MRTNLSSICLSIVLALSVAAAGCSGCTESTGVTESDGGSSDAIADGTGTDAVLDGGGDDVGEDGAGGDDALSCPDATTCGGTCCSPGQECVMGTCREPCGGTRCGAQKQYCCTGKEVCIFESCQTPGDKCQNSFQCAEDEYCEKTLGRCLPKSAQNNSCTFKPEPGPYTPDREGAFDGVETNNSIYNKSITAPTVADVDADGLPEITVLLYRGGLSGALIAVLNGEDRSLLAYGAVENVVPNSAGIAVGDLDTSTETLEIVAPKKGGGLVALSLDKQGGTLEQMWTNDKGALGSISTEAAPSIADLDGDGTPEVVFGFSVVSAEGKIWRGLNGGPAGAQRDNSGLTSVVDLDGKKGANGNRDLEIVSGNRAIKIDGSTMWDASGEVPDGYSAVGDFGNDGRPEVVTVSNRAPDPKPGTQGDVYVLNGRTGDVIFGPKGIPGGGDGGPPTIADFDNDGFVEFAAAGQGQYTVYDLDCQGQNPNSKRCASGRSDGILWTTSVQDISSSRTGSSVFDFEGDGKAEVVYNDECFLRVFDGQDGEVLFERANTSRTGTEYPIVVDVDKDFNSEIVVVSNNDQIDRDQCEENYNNYPTGGTTGVFVYGDADDEWVPTRQIWNEHAYHITNVLEDGSIPKQEQLHYESDVTNSFRLNVQPDGLFNAPDLVVTSVEVAGTSCGDTPQVRIEVTVENQGTLGVGPGIAVDVRAKIGGNTVDVGDVTTTKRLLPGQSETRSLQWKVPKSGANQNFTVVSEVDPEDEVTECRSGNNTSETEVDPGEFDVGELKLRDLSIDDGFCGAGSWELPIEVEIENTGSKPVPKEIPVAFEAGPSSAPTQIGSVKTSQQLGPGETQRLEFEWTVDSAFRDSRFNIQALIDPEGDVYTCGGNKVSTVADCTTGG